MGLFPNIENPHLNNDIDINLKPKKNFLFDFKEGDFITENGNVVFSNEIESLKIWIEKILRTEKFKFKIYEQVDYGITLIDIVMGNKIYKDFALIEVKREVISALKKNNLIQNIENFNIKKEGRSLNISFRVILKKGMTFEKVVIINAV